MKTICLIGATGFVGQPLQRAIERSGFFELRVLQHRTSISAGTGKQVIQGDFGDPRSLRQLLIPGSIVVNLAYAGEDSALHDAAVLGQSCRDIGVQRLIHISTAMVYGNPRVRRINEDTTCKPTDEYGRTKLGIEAVLNDSARNAFQIVILRPTAIIGPGGRNLETLATRVARASRIERMLRAMVMGHRRMHMVDVEALVMAIMFFANGTLAAAQQLFIVSDDEHPLNNYRAMESCLADALGAPRLPQWLPYAPASVFRLLLRAIGRPDPEPDRIYSPANLQTTGFLMPRDLRMAIIEYAKWFADQSHVES